MRTYDYILKELGLSRGDELSLNDLDDRIENVLEDDVRTLMGDGYEAEEVLKSLSYNYDKNGISENNDTVYFEIVQINKIEPVDSIIKIL